MKTARTITELNDNGIASQNLPASRSSAEKDDRTEAVLRTLTANMTGHVMLTGNSADLHFYKGSLKKISKEGRAIISGMNSRTRFVTSRGTIAYRNESAFSFDDYPKYGLRTLQIPQNRKQYDFRLITDFILEENQNEAIVSITVNYPIFEQGTIIKEAAVFETPLFSLNEAKVEITADGNREKTIIIHPEDTKNLLIPGKAFEIKSENRTFRLTFLEKIEGHRFSLIEGLSVGTGYSNGNKVLYINPGGSYSPAPAWCYSGLREQFGFKIGAEQSGKDAEPLS
ncbi:MAG: hypothetical protein JEZ04_04980 [Spirochaetales bacterium]|nr:hypothetical protein [Spirochaetales bacterium]